MRNVLFAIALVLVSAAAASAQDGPRVEAFGGYSFLHDSRLPRSATADRDTHGFEVGGAYSVLPWLGLEGSYARSSGERATFAVLPTEQPLPGTPTSVNVDVA